MADVLTGRLPAAGTWAAAGVDGGIPDTSGWAVVDVTQAPYNVDNTGVASAVAGINSAISAQAATANAIIYLPAGSYKIDGQVSIAKNNLLLKGDGVTTILVVSGSTRAIYAGNSSAWSGNDTAISGDYSVGDTVLTVADTTGFSAGQMARVWQENDLTIPVINPYDFDLLQAQVVRVASIGVGTVTITPGLVFPLDSTLNPQLFFNGTVKKKMGIEDIYIDASASTASNTPLIELNCAVDSWVTGVRFYQANSYNLYLNYALQCEISGNYFDEIQLPQPNNAGIKLDTVGSSLIFDNIFYIQFPGVQVNGQPVTGRSNNYVGGGSSANVIAYNYALNSPNVSGSGQVGYSYVTDHGAHNTFNLYEGNAGAKLVQDGFYGSDSGDTIVRNHLRGVDPAATNLVECLVLGRFTRQASAVGNILGTAGSAFTVTATASGGSGATRYIYRIGYPNAGNRTFSGTAEPSTGDYWADWGTGPGPSGFQEKDLDVANTLLLKGNYNTEDAGVPAGENLGTDTISASYYLSSRPAWATKWWPVYDPDSGADVDDNDLPAGFRYNNPGDTYPDYTPTDLTAVAVSSSGINLAWTDNATGEDGYLIQRSTDGVTFADVETIAAGSTSYNDTGLSASTQYWYRVCATSGNRTSPFSNEADDTTDAPPAAGSGITPGTLVLVGLTT